MDIKKYRKLYLSLFRGGTAFIMIIYRVDKPFNDYSLGDNHPLVKKGCAFWESDNELCTGYYLGSNYEIYRPIYSYVRQELLDKVNTNIRNPNNFWNKIKSRYFITISKIKKLPIELSKNIIEYIY